MVVRWLVFGVNPGGGLSAAERNGTLGACTAERSAEERVVSGITRHLGKRAAGNPGPNSGGFIKVELSDGKLFMVALWNDTNRQEDREKCKHFSDSNREVRVRTAAAWLGGIVRN